MNTPRWDPKSLEAFVTEAKEFLVSVHKALGISCTAQIAITVKDKNLTIDPDKILDDRSNEVNAKQVRIAYQGTPLESRIGLGIAINYPGAVDKHPRNELCFISWVRRDLEMSLADAIQRGRISSNRRQLELSQGEAVQRNGILFAESIYKKTILLESVSLETRTPHIDDATVTFFRDCSTISSLKYEGSQCIGQIVLCKDRQHPAISETSLRFTDRTRLASHRSIRKLLEVSSQERPLLMVEGQTVGWGNLQEHNPSALDLFRVSFLRDQCWNLMHDDKVILRVERGHPTLSVKEFDSENLQDALSKIVSDDHAIMSIKNFIEAVVRSRRGGMVVVSQTATEEAQRLNGQSFGIEPVRVKKEHFPLAKIDGAVILDTAGYLHAFGVILDGLAVPNCGSRERGARYNSAIRYLNKPEFSDGISPVIVVVSEDGMVDIFPGPMKGE